MDYRELLEKFKLQFNENRRLIKENNMLKAQLGITQGKPPENPIAEPTLIKPQKGAKVTKSEIKM